MATIRISIDESKSISIFEIEGEVTADDIIAAMDRQYTNGAPPHALWDYSNATFHGLGSVDYNRIALAAKRLAASRDGGRTAFVASTVDLEAVAIRLLQATSKAIDLPIELQVFGTRDDALAWLPTGG